MLVSYDLSGKCIYFLRRTCDQLCASVYAICSVWGPRACHAFSQPRSTVYYVEAFYSNRSRSWLAHEIQWPKLNRSTECFCFRLNFELTSIDGLARFVGRWVDTIPAKLLDNNGCQQEVSQVCFGVTIFRQEGYEGRTRYQDVCLEVFLGAANQHSLYVNKHVCQSVLSHDGGVPNHPGLSLTSNCCVIYLVINLPIFRPSINYSSLSHVNVQTILV